MQHEFVLEYSSIGKIITHVIASDNEVKLVREKKGVLGKNNELPPVAIVRFADLHDIVFHSAQGLTQPWGFIEFYFGEYAEKGLSITLGGKKRGALLTIDNSALVRLQNNPRCVLFGKRDAKKARECFETMHDLYRKFVRKSHMVQSDPQDASPRQDDLNQEAIEKLKQYKELFDLDIISKEEYDEKKREILESSCG